MKIKVLKFFTLFLVLLVFTANTALAVFADSPTNRARKVRVGYFPLNGYHEVDRSGTHSGYGYEYLHSIAKYNNWEIEYIDGTLAECKKMLANGQIDILTNVKYTDENALLYDFSDENIGISKATLTVKAGNNKFLRDEFETFTGMRVGILRGNNNNNDLKKYSLKNQFTYEEIEFEDLDIMHEALMKGNIDALLTSNLRKTSNEWVLAQFESSPFYVAVRKGNSALLNEINNSLTALEAENPLLSLELHNKYYSTSGLTTVMSKKEKDYVKNAKPVKVATWPEHEPISYYENGTSKGIVPDLMRLAASEIGIEIQFIETKSYAESCKLVQEGKADIMTNFTTDFDTAQAMHVKITEPYMRQSYLRISKNGNIVSHPKVAVSTDAGFISKFVYENFPYREIAEYSNTKQALEAVRRGDADVTYANSIVAQYYLGMSKNSNLIFTSSDQISHSVSMAVSKYAPIELYNLLNRELFKIKNTTLPGIINEYTTLKSSSVTWTDFVYSNPITVIFITLMIFFTIVICAMSMSITRFKYVKRLKDLAFKDQLTGIWNVAKFELEAQQAFNDNKRSGKTAIIAIDVCKFRTINQVYGRKVGDDVINFVANELSTLSPTEFFPAHVKADNFLALVYFNDKAEIESLLKKLRDNVFAFQSNEQYVSVSINCGIYFAKEKCCVTTAIDNADKARRQSKNEPEGYLIYDETLEDILQREKYVEDKFPLALSGGEFEVYYQPKIDMRTEKIFGAEALIRWNCKERGFMMPDDFIPVLEKTGAIVELDFYVLEQVCIYISSFLTSGRVPPKISVNQSRMHLPRANYISKLSDLINKYNIPQGIIELELTEAGIIDLDLTKIVVRRLKALGFLLSVDDFGSGYSSLTFLNAVQIDVMKIDRAFLQATDVSQRSRQILKRMVDMANDLNMQVVCEGVETISQIDFLLSIGCDYAQGYYYDKPMQKALFDEKWRAN